MQLPIRLRLSVVWMSVTFLRPTQPVEIFGNFLRRLVPWPSIDIHGKFYGDRPREPSVGGFKRKRGSQI